MPPELNGVRFRPRDEEQLPVNCFSNKDAIAWPSITRNKSWLKSQSHHQWATDLPAPHTFANVSDATVEFFSIFTPAYDELADLCAQGWSNPEENLSLMLRHATVPADG